MDGLLIQEAIERLTAACQADQRIVALLLYGSHARGAADEFSDLDFGVVTTDAARDEVIANRDVLVRHIGEPLFLDDFGDPANVHAILADGLTLELIFSAAGELMVAGPHRVLLDKAGVVPAHRSQEPPRPPMQPSAEEVRRLIYGFWHEAEHIAAALGRGQLLWAHGGLEQLRGTCLKLARLRAGAEREDNEPYWKADQVLDETMRAALRATIVPPDAAQMRDAALALVRLYQSLAEPTARKYGFAYPTDLDRIVMMRMAD